MQERISAELQGSILVTADIACAYVSNNMIPASELPALINAIYVAVRSVSDPTRGIAQLSAKPSAAEIQRSIRSDALISMIDGKPYKTLKRHLLKHGLDFETYKFIYGLPHDYPSVAADFSWVRSQLAIKRGFGKRTSEGVVFVDDASST